MILKSLRLTLADQFAFRPTGSATAAIISILQTITSTLKTEETVTIIFIDFSKAFDTVNHSTLVQKRSRLNLPDNIYNWMVDFLLDQKHRTRYAGQLSVDAAINASIVKGSGFGPPAYMRVCGRGIRFTSVVHDHNAIG